LIVPLLSKPILDEYRAVLMDDALTARFPELTPTLVEMTIRQLRFIGDYLRSPAARFEYRRDLRDQKFIELAIELSATHILSADKDLLSLPRGRTEASRRFRQRLPGVSVVTAAEFVRLYVPGVEG
jgi:putative PIN family toxin of toxin-antitoxin system